MDLVRASVIIPLTHFFFIHLVHIFTVSTKDFWIISYKNKLTGHQLTHSFNQSDKYNIIIKYKKKKKKSIWKWISFQLHNILMVLVYFFFLYTKKTQARYNGALEIIFSYMYPYFYPFNSKVSEELTLICDVYGLQICGKKNSTF